MQENPASQAEENDAHDRQGRQVMAQRGQMAGQEEFADGALDIQAMGKAWATTWVTGSMASRGHV